MVNDMHATRYDYSLEVSESKQYYFNNNLLLLIMIQNMKKIELSLPSETFLAVACCARTRIDLVTIFISRFCSTSNIVRINQVAILLAMLLIAIITR